MGTSAGRIAIRIAFAALALAMAVAYYEFLGPAPTPSERREATSWWRPVGVAHASESDWLAPLQKIGRDVEEARHEGRTEPRGLIPLGLFAVPAIALAALGVLLSRGLLWRIGVLALGLTLCAFSYYGWLDPETWQDYSWRWPATLAATAGFVSIFVLAPAVVGRFLERGSARLAALAALVWMVAVYFLSTEITGTNPHLEWNISPWPTLTLYGFELVGLVLGVVYLAAGAGLLARGDRPAPLRAAAAAALAALLAAALARIPFSAIGPLALAVLALPAAAVAALAGRGDGQRARAGLSFLVAGLLVVLAIKVGQWQGERFLAQSRDQIAPRVIAAIERYRKEHDAYPDELSQLLPAYLTEIPPPRVGWFDSEDATFLYTNLGDSFLLEFPGIVWMQCAYSPAFREDAPEAPERGGSPAAAGGDALEASWSCESKPPQLW